MPVTSKKSITKGRTDFWCLMLFLGITRHRRRLRGVFWVLQFWNGFDGFALRNCGGAVQLCVFWVTASAFECIVTAWLNLAWTHHGTFFLWRKAGSKRCCKLTVSTREAKKESPPL